MRRESCGAINERPGPVLPEQVQSEKSQGVRGTESPDSFDNTLKKTENYVSVFSGEVHTTHLLGNELLKDLNLLCGVVFL